MAHGFPLKFAVTCKMNLYYINLKLKQCKHVNFTKNLELKSDFEFFLSLLKAASIVNFNCNKLLACLLVTHSIININCVCPIENFNRIEKIRWQFDHFDRQHRSIGIHSYIHSFKFSTICCHHKLFCVCVYFGFFFCNSLCMYKQNWSLHFALNKWLITIQLNVFQICMGTELKNLKCAYIELKKQKDTKSNLSLHLFIIFASFDLWSQYQI